MLTGINFGLDDQGTLEQEIRRHFDDSGKVWVRVEGHLIRNNEKKTDAWLAFIEQT